MTATSREDRGALTIVTATYGDTAFSNSNGECEWWSVSSGLYTRHKTKWITNSPSAIKSFCASCISEATYKDGCNVSCSPVAGEDLVLCEATWSEKPEDRDGGGGDDDDGDNGGDNGGGNDDGNKDDTKTTGKSVQFSSSTETITLDYETLKEKHPKIKANPDALKVITLMENGSVSWQEANGGLIEKSGWYKVSNNTLALKEGPVVTNDKITPELVGEIKRILDNPPQFTFPVIRCSVTSKVEGSSNMSINSMVADLGSVGTKSQSINAGNSAVGAPELKPLNVLGMDGLTFKTNWIYEGSSYDNGGTYSKAVNGKLKFVGEVTKSYRTVTELA